MKNKKFDFKYYEFIIENIIDKDILKMEFYDALSEIAKMLGKSKINKRLKKKIELMYYNSFKK